MAEPLPPPRSDSLEQSNSSILFPGKLLLKLFRRQQAGTNPDIEIGRYLTETAHFPHVAPFGGSIEYLRQGRPASTLAMLQGFVANEGDGWRWTLEVLDRYYEAIAPLTIPPECLPAEQPHLLRLSETPETPFAAEHVGGYLQDAGLLGVRTAELHLALARNRSDPAFAPEPLSGTSLRQLRDNLAEHANGAFATLKENLSRLPDPTVELAGLVLSRRRQALERFRQLGESDIHATRMRIHGDYHLGQVLRAKGDFAILDFEGEPARSLEERRSKQSPLKDVAGMLRSFGYAAFSALIQYSSRRPEEFQKLEPWARLWEQAVSAAFLRAYRQTAGGSSIVPSDGPELDRLLEAYVLDKALYELVYELNNRPNWVRIPLTGILALPI